MTRPTWYDAIFPAAASPRPREQDYPNWTAYYEAKERWTRETRPLRKTRAQMAHYLWNLAITLGMAAAEFGVQAAIDVNPIDRAAIFVGLAAAWIVLLAIPYAIRSVEPV